MRQSVSLDFLHIPAWFIYKYLQPQMPNFFQSNGIVHSFQSLRLTGFQWGSTRFQDLNQSPCDLRPSDLFCSCCSNVFFLRNTPKSFSLLIPSEHIVRRFFAIIFACLIQQAFLQFAQTSFIADLFFPDSFYHVFVTPHAQRSNTTSFAALRSMPFHSYIEPIWALFFVILSCTILYIDRFVICFSTFPFHYKPLATFLSAAFQIVLHPVAHLSFVLQQPYFSSCLGARPNSTGKLKENPSQRFKQTYCLASYSTGQFPRSCTGLHKVN